MAAAVMVGWHGFQEVFPEHGEGFKQCRPRDDTPYADDRVGKLRRCGHPDPMGSIAYRCLHGGPGQQRVSMRWKSSLCWRCAQVSVDDWVAPVGKRLQAGVLYRPMVLTVPEV